MSFSKKDLPQSRFSSYYRDTLEDTVLALKQLLGELLDQEKKLEEEKKVILQENKNVSPLQRERLMASVDLRGRLGRLKGKILALRSLIQKLEQQEGITH